ncbi:MAG: hypothetical protein WCE38_10420 [Burkholderiales bacterium]
MLDMSHDFRAGILAGLIATPPALAEPVVARMPLPAEPYSFAAQGAVAEELLDVLHCGRIHLA